MAFPFQWVGALIAAAFLAIVFIVFGILLKIVNRAATDVRGSILPGLIGGIRDWTVDHGLAASATSSPRADEGASPIEETTPVAGLRLEDVRRERGAGRR
jgi:hypothetical protein